MPVSVSKADTYLRPWILNRKGSGIHNVCSPQGGEVMLKSVINAETFAKSEGRNNTNKIAGPQ